jgi:nitroreductase
MNRIPLAPNLAGRFSARSYRPEPIGDDMLLSILEAARWAPSSLNEQPWSFVIARRQDPEAFEALHGCLMGNNLVWAKDAAVLMVCSTARQFTQRDRPNRHAWHDLGLAVMSMQAQAAHLGLQSRQMGGIDGDKACALYQIPETHDVVSGLAFGFPASEQPAERPRKELKDFIFEGSWGHPASLVLGAAGGA